MHIVAFVYEGVKWIIIITKGQNLRCILDSVALSKRYSSNNKEINTFQPIHSRYA